MKSLTMWARITIGAVCSLAVILQFSRPVGAQSPTVVHQGGDGSDYTAWVGVTAGQVGDFDVIATAPGSDAVVKNAPYSAEAVSEMVQLLSDGTRIVRDSTSSVYRDSAGRTRREHGLTVIGPLAANPDADERIITITDPDAGVSYMLNPGTRTARKMTTRLVVSGEPPNAVRSRLMVPDAATESLGTQFIEGVFAEGTRTTMTIPTGQVGNDRPIQVVSDRWYSPDLQVLVMSRQSDPRYGETTYRLTDVVRSEPLFTLFEVPPDFEVIEGPGLGTVYREFRVQ